LELYEHQKLGVKKLLEHSRFGLFWDMGTGKTRTVLHASAQLKRPLIVVHHPKVVRYTWEEENQAYQLPIEFYTYESFKKLKPEDINDKILVFDEAHLLKNPKSGRGSHAYYLLQESFPCRVFLLTGTPCLLYTSPSPRD